MPGFFFFYWEKEVDGQNDGYKITYIGTAYDKLAYSSNFCVEHDDGGRISEYGYGYYYGGLMPGGRLRMEKLAALVSCGKLDLKPLSTHVFEGFDHLEEALFLMRDKPADLQSVT